MTRRDLLKTAAALPLAPLVAKAAVEPYDDHAMQAKAVSEWFERERREGYAGLKVDVEGDDLLRQWGTRDHAQLFNCEAIYEDYGWRLNSDPPAEFILENITRRLWFLSFRGLRYAVMAFTYDEAFDYVRSMGL